MTLARRLSLLLAAAFCIHSVFLHSSQLTVVTAGYVIAPLAFIWFGDELGGYASGWQINQPTPGVFIKLMGWVLLCLTPLVVWSVRIRLEW